VERVHAHCQWFAPFLLDPKSLDEQSPYCRELPATQIIPSTIAARKPNDMIAASTFSRVFSSIDASFAGLSGRLARREPAPAERPYKDEFAEDKQKSLCTAMKVARRHKFLSCIMCIVRDRHSEQPSSVLLKDSKMWEKF
jgi:hypothetical protein